MTRKEANRVLEVLEHIKEPDGRVQEAIAIIKRQIAVFDSKIGQLKTHYEVEFPW